MPYKQRVTGSNPVAPTKLKPDNNQAFLLSVIFDFAYPLILLSYAKKICSTLLNQFFLKW